MTSALAQGLVQFPHGCPPYPYPRALAGHEPWERRLDSLAPGCALTGALLLSPPALLQPVLSLEACPPKRGCGQWWALWLKPSQLPAVFHWLQGGGERSQPWVTVPICLGTGCRWLSPLRTGYHCWWWLPGWHWPPLRRELLALPVSPCPSM